MPFPVRFAIALMAVWPCANLAKPAFYPDFRALSVPLFAEQPDIPACLSGRLRDETEHEAWQTLNDIRGLHGLAPVALNRQNKAVAQAALMLAANGRLEHAPPASWRCYTAAGAQALAGSLLSGGVTAPNIAFHTPAQDIIAWLIDNKATAAGSIGHRRWLLDPFLSEVAYGRVSGSSDGRKLTAASVLEITGTVRPAQGPDLIAYPFQDYPARLFHDDTLLSLSLLVDRQRRQGNAAVDFSGAKIRVVTEQGRSLRVRDVAFDRHAFGLPNNLQFRPVGLRQGLRYEVSVDGVRVGGLEKSYRYWFRIVPD